MLASVRFKMGDFDWAAEREGVLFEGQTDAGPVDFLITSAALAELLDPDLGTIDRDTALETFIDYEADIHRIAHREFVSRLGASRRSC